MDDVYSVLQAAVDDLAEKLQHPDLEVETRKIQQKLREARFNKGDVKPLADCVLAVLLAAKSGGHSVRSVFDALGKLAEEIGRKQWKKMPDGTYRAV